jgi:hypothetical protein
MRFWFLQVFVTLVVETAKVLACFFEITYFENAFSKHLHKGRMIPEKRYGDDTYGDAL